MHPLPTVLDLEPGREDPRIAAEYSPSELCDANLQPPESRPHISFPNPVQQQDPDLSPRLPKQICWHYERGVTSHRCCQQVNPVANRDRVAQVGTSSQCQEDLGKDIQVKCTAEINLQMVCLTSCWWRLWHPASFWSPDLACTMILAG